MSLKVHQFKSSEIFIANGESIAGRGAYGVVYRGVHKIYGDVAVKVSTIRDEIKAKEKIKDEMEYLSQASHENVVRVFGWTITMKTIAIVMELLPGGNLLELLLDEDVTLSPLLSLKFCAEISSGIAFLHNLPGGKIVHGDIKAENILLTSYLKCKLGDFGEAMVSTYTRDVMSNQTRPKYTLIYAAPELLSNPSEKRYPSYDTFSLAVTMYAVLNRKLPISSEQDLPMYLETIKSKQRPSIDSLNRWKEALAENGQISEARIIQLLIQVMQNCWEHTPLLHPSMLEVKERLCKHLDQFHPSKILEHVIEATKNVEFYKLSRNSSLAPLDQVLASRYSQESHENIDIASIADSENVSRPTSTQDIPSSLQLLNVNEESPDTDTHQTSPMPSTTQERSPLLNVPRRETVTMPSNRPCGSSNVIRNSQTFSTLTTFEKPKEVKLKTRTVDIIPNDDCLQMNPLYSRDYSSSLTDILETYSRPSYSEKESSFSTHLRNKPSGISSPELINSTAFQNNQEKHVKGNLYCQDVLGLTESKLEGPEYIIFKEIKAINSLLRRKNIQQAVFKSHQLIIEEVPSNSFICERMVGQIVLLSRSFQKLPQPELVTSVLLINWCIKFNNNLPFPLNKLKLLEDCCNELHDITKSMNKSKMQSDIGAYCLPFLKDLHENKLDCSHVDKKWNKIVSITCLLNIGYCHFYLQDYVEAKTTCQQCRSQTKEALGDRAKRHHLYADACFLCAQVNQGMGNHSLALLRGQEAIGTYQNVKDMDEKKRNKNMAEIRNSCFKSPQ